MTYSKLIEMQIDEVFLEGTAAKILQHMDRIRNVSDLNQSRRWVMELIQNARDIAYPDRNVKVRIELGGSTLKFMHSGRPFRIRDILSIVNQVSAKGDDNTSVGKFGTGFMTTYQLSEQVEINSVLSDHYDGDPLPPKKFHITVDRHGRSAKEILDGIDQSMTELRNADGFPETDFDPDGFNTVFTYHLDNDDSRSSARTGVDDLKHNILFIMLFSKRIESIEISADNDETVYERAGEKILSEGLKCAEISCKRNGEKHIRRIVYSEDGKLSAAAPIDENNRFIRISEKTPRLFIDFPLIGAESFPFPVVINDIEFRPNEPRSGITLVDNIKSTDAVINKQIMLRAVGLFKEMINAACSLGFSGFENVIASPEFTDSKEISKDWFTENVSRTLYEIISDVPFLPTAHGAAALSEENVRLISYKTEKQADMIKALTAVLNGYSVPTDNIDWAAAFANYPIDPQKTVDAEMLCKNASYYVEKLLDKESCSVSEWCSMLYAAALCDEALGIKIRSGEYAVFPDQAEKTQLHSIKDIYRDPGIPEIFKQINDRLDEDFESKYFLRSSLLSLDFDPQNDGSIPLYEISRIKSRISDCTSLHFEKYSGLAEAVLLMISCGKNDDIYSLLKSVYPGPIPPKTDIGGLYDANTWHNSYNNALDMICRETEKYSSLDELAKAIGADSPDTAVEWLNRLFQYNVSKAYRIYPNIYGRFISANRIKGNIFSHIPSFNAVSEQFIGILEKIHIRNALFIYDFDYILDRRIKSSYLNIGTLTDEHFSVKINNAIKSVMNSGSLGDASENIQQACTMLLNYITKDPEDAMEYFPDFASMENRMKLLTPNEALKLSDKAAVLDGLMKKFNLSDNTEPERILTEYMKQQESCKYLYSDEWDCDFGSEDVNGMSESEFEDFCRNGGTAGEKYVFGDVCRRLESAGWSISESSAHTALFKKDAEETAEVCRPDSEHYKQCGWDIRITLSSKARNETYYIEVKTHTENSARKNRIKLSRAQFRMAVTAKENYIAALAEYKSADKECSTVKYYRDICRYIENGGLNPTSGIELCIQ